MNGMRVWLCTIGVLLAASVPLNAVARMSAPMPSPTSSADAQYAAFLRGRNERLGAWLPRAENLFEPWRRHVALAVDTLPSFGDEDLAPNPGHATGFWYGDAGPPRVGVVYDAVRGIARYQQGCCSWSEAVLAYASPPPEPVVRADLDATRTRTRRGIALGASVADVRRAYGPAKLHTSTTDARYQVLSYVRMRTESCGAFENFAFRGGRLVLVEAGDGC